MCCTLFVHAQPVTSQICFWPCRKWRTIFTPEGLFQTLNAALSAIEFAKKKHSAMLKKVKTAYLAEKLKIQNWFHKHFKKISLLVF